MTQPTELTPDEFLALQQLRLTEAAEITHPEVVASLEEKGFIARSDRGWAVTRSGEKRFREQTGDDAGGR